jgi:hypothetical protein
LGRKSWSYWTKMTGLNSTTNYLKRMTSLGRSRNLTSLKMTLRTMSCYYYLKRAPTS